MVRRNRARSSSLFLMELIIAILFFSVFSAVCVQFFVKSHLLSNDSNALNHAVNECASIAEIINTSDDLADSINMLKNLYPDGIYPDIHTDTTESDILICYDDSFQECAKDDAAYLLSLHITADGQMINADMHFAPTDSESYIYELSTKHHIARRSDYEER